MALELDKFRPETATPLEVAQLWERHQELMRQRVGMVIKQKSLLDTLAPFVRYARAHEEQLRAESDEEVRDDRIVFRFNGVDITVGDLRRAILVNDQVRGLIN